MGGNSDTIGRVNTGGRYNPSTNSWMATSTTNAPTGRFFHTAVWNESGNEMIVWGGFDGDNANTGGRYNPSTNSWMTTSTTNAPSARYYHTAVWTGSEMIIWGGFDNTGGRYNPNTNSWTATTTFNAPAGRTEHTAVWTGSEMIVWGGSTRVTIVNTGGRYNPSTDSWTDTTTGNAPTGRFVHTAVWTGSEMVVWGGFGGVVAGDFNTGGRYCAPSGAPITLSAAKHKVGAINMVRLTWSGATSTYIDVYRDDMPISRTKNRGSFDVSTGDTGRARYTYRVCEFGTSTCSNDAIATFAH